MSIRFQVLKQRLASLEDLLEDTDLIKLSKELLRHRIISKEFCDKFSSLDRDHMESDIKVRYLLKQVCERVGEDGVVLDRLVRVLGKLGGKVRAECEAMKSELGKMEGNEVLSGTRDTHLVEQDVPDLVECLVSGSHLWDAIGIALNLPKHKREDCGEGKEIVKRLSNILTAWILGGYEGARPATLSSLRRALASETVGLGKLALNLSKFKKEIDPLPGAKKSLYIIYQSCDTEVAEDKSTLLEVQVRCSGCDSYQWSKDGEPLLDGADFCGVCSNILCINRASQCTEGKYSCRVSRGSETACSNEISLSVIYPPEKKELLEFYSLADRDVPQDSWSPVSNPTFINLVLIQQKPMSTRNYYTIRGDMDDILESKEVAEYEEVFREYREGAVVLVEGRPGSGKTTLVNKLTRDWATGKKVLQGAKIVFLVTLRLLNVSGREKSLLDLLQIFYGEGLSKIVEQCLREGKGKGACFILDGLDEYPIESKKNLVIDQLLFSKTFLPHSMVIVASRPVATEKLKTMCKTRIEVVGFSKDQIYSYVRTYPFNDRSPGMACKMTEFLDQHPNVLHMCYLPVHAAMICFLFNILEGNLPHRETQIYEKFTIATILKHKARKGEDFQLKSLEDLSGDEKEWFHSIYKLAFDMLINSQLVISKSDAKVSLCPDSVLGLLTVECTSLYHGKEDLFNFSHLTLQEFLAANYLCKTKLTERMLLQEPCLKNVWKFYCGLMQYNNIVVAKTIIGSVFHDFLYRVRCAYESRDVELCDILLPQGVLEIKKVFLNSMDCIALGYVISKSTEPVEEIILDNCKWVEEGMMLLGSEILSIKLQSIKILKLFTAKDVLWEDLFMYLVPFLEELSLNNAKVDPYIIEYFNRLCKLKITESHLDSDWIGVLSNAMTIGFYVQFLDLSSNSIGSYGASVLAKGLKFTNELKSLNLNSNNIGSHGAIALASALQSCSQLESLSLNDNCIHETECWTLKEKLSFCKMLDLNHQKPCNYIDVGKKVVIYNGRSKEILWDKYGFSISLGSCNISAASEVVITAIANAECTFPSDSKLVSGIFHIESSGTINSTSIIRIQHCCPQSKDLTFVHCSDETLEFTTLPEGAFTDTYGEITVNSFSYYAIVSDDRGKKEYLSSLYFSRQPNKHHEGQVYCSWDMHISVVRNCSVYERRLELYYFYEEKEFELHHSFVAEFDGNRTEVKLSIPHSEIQSGWHIKNINQETIFRTDIDSCTCGFPSQITCQLLLYIQQDVSNLNCYLSMDGLKQPNNSFKIIRVLPDGK